MYETETVAIADIKLKPELQVRVKIDQATVGQYALQMASGEHIFPPVEIYEIDGELLLVSGWHRIAARKKNGDTTIEAIIHRGKTMSDALLAAVKADAYSAAPRTIKDKHHGIKMLLEDPISKDRSNSWIANQVGVDHKTVNQFRDPKTMYAGTSNGNPQHSKVKAKPDSRHKRGKTHSKKPGPKPRDKPKPAAGQRAARQAADERRAEELGGKLSAQRAAAGREVQGEGSETSASTPTVNGSGAAHDQQNVLDAPSGYSDFLAKQVEILEPAKAPTEPEPASSAAGVPPSPDPESAPPPEPTPPVEPSEPEPAPETGLRALLREAYSAQNKALLAAQDISNRPAGMPKAAQKRRNTAISRRDIPALLEEYDIAAKLLQRSQLAMPLLMPSLRG
jgi:hypothetical protein